jgi:mRNA-degrading endonuclease RelE of RelBE toxin-antitoxin system
MNYRLTTIKCFDVAAKRLAKKYPSFKSDLAEFCKTLLENPKQGAELYPGIRKIRLAIKSKGKGKSGGARVISYDFITKEMDGEIVLLLIYDKENASTVDVNVLKQIIREAGLPID